MNYKLHNNYLILIITSFTCGCGSVPNENKNVAPVSKVSLHVKNDKYLGIDTKKSVVTWRGSSLNGLNTQTGYIYISKGELLVENDQLTGGVVEVDMNSIEDKNHVSDNKLIKHLKDPDFFEVNKFPFSVISITKVAAMNSPNKNVTGNLMIKGVTHPVTFPARIEVKKGIVNVEGKLVIDRTKWNVRYKSAKFYANLANQTMSDSIEFHMKVTAKRK